MSGETEANVSAWTPDTLHSYFIRLLDEMDRRNDQRFAAQEEAIQIRSNAQEAALAIRARGTTEEIEYLRSFFNSVLDERDQRYGERFEASQTAITAANVEREKAVTAALIAQEKAVAAALAAADRAVAKAEAAAERRFESVNEFRQTLTDQAALFVTRNEVDTKISSMSTKITDNSDQAQKDISALSSRMDRSEGGKIGVQEQKQGISSNVAMVGTLTAIIFGVITIVMAIFLKG